MTETALIAANSLTPWNEVDDAAKLAALVASMEADGWVGTPVVVDGDQAVTGSHRIVAARRADIEVPTIDIRDLFADAGLDYDNVVEEYGGDRYEIVVRADQFLPASIVDQYGLDAH